MDTDALEETADEDEVAVVSVERTSEKKTYKRSFWRLVKMSAPLWPYVCLGSICAILSGALVNPIFNFMLGELLQVFYEKVMDEMERDVQKYVLVLVGVGFAAIVIQMVQHYYFGVVAEILGARVKETTFRAFTIRFVEWRLTLVMLATFPLLVLSTIGQEACKPAKRALFCGNISSVFFGLSVMIGYCSYGLILWYGSTLVKNGTSDFGSVIKVLMIISAAACEVGAMIGPMLRTIKNFKILDSTFAITNHQTSMDADDSSSEVVQSISGSIELVDVEFAYPTRPDVTIFRGLNLNIKARQRIALVGAKGCGKSSLIALVERFYDPTKGRVMIDGKDIRELNLRSLRQSIGLVQSDPVLFKTSMSENILCGRQGATPTEVQKAAEVAEAHIFIQALPHGYDTQVGDAGEMLNRGQQQRVAIARVVLKDPAILLVDDVTAGLDFEQEKVVQEAVDHLMLNHSTMMAERTTIVVTHNLADICMVADNLCVVEGGCIVEQGSHGELMEAQGSYARLFNIQRARDCRCRPSQ